MPIALAWVIWQWGASAPRVPRAKGSLWRVLTHAGALGSLSILLGVVVRPLGGVIVARTSVVRRVLLRRKLVPDVQLAHLPAAGQM